MQKQIFFLIGRDNWQKDDALNHFLLEKLKQYNQKIVWEDPAGHLIYKLRRLESNFKRLPGAIRKLDLRMVQISYGLIHWSYFSYLAQRRDTSIKTRVEQLKKSLLGLTTKQGIIIISRSAGGRFASMVADELNINHIICLGYPFKHPDKEAEPDRYEHLATLKTPMLIVQGDQDEYGGIEIREKYAFSPGIDLMFVSGNHDFQISSTDWERVLRKVAGIQNS
jgi:hypothetical protein